MATRAATARPERAVDRTYARDLVELAGEQVTLHGWLEHARKVKSMRFLAVRDRTGKVQAVCRDDQLTAAVDEITPESAIRVTGTVRETTDPRFGAVEIEVDQLDVLSKADTPLPLHHHSDTEERLDNRHLDLRPRNRFLIFEVQTTLEAAMREFALSRAFMEIHSPKITAGGSESGATVFQVPYFDDQACLVQSPQFYMQMSMAAGFDRAFEVGPVFRSEPGVTPRHATEFTIAHYEMSWIDSHEDLMRFEEELLRYALSVVEDVHGRDVERYLGIPVEVPPESIPRIAISDAPELIGKSLDETVGENRSRLLATTEQALSKHAQQEHGHSFVFLTDYPAADRPFYTMKADDGNLSHSFDLLWRGIELTSGGQREHRYEPLRTQMGEAGLEPEVLAAYLEPYFLEMFRYGCPPHGGFGIGINRLLMSLLAQPSIRETSFVFRGPGRFVP